MARDAAAKAAAAVDAMWAGFPMLTSLQERYLFGMMRNRLLSRAPAEQHRSTELRWSRHGWDGCNARPMKQRAMEPIGGVSWLEMRCYMASTLLRDTIP